MPPGSIQPESRVSRDRRGIQVSEFEVEPLRQCAHPFVARIDELTAMLGHLATVEIPRRPATPADPFRVCLEDRARVTVPVQLIGAAQPGEPGADNRDPWARLSTRIS